MCGIAGIFVYHESAPTVDEQELLRIREHMLSRGPDGAGLWISPDHRIGLAHRRLAIIDLSTDAAQPMASADGRYQIVFNGEIYNYRELQAELQTHGVVFRSHSDTEVLLQLYIHDHESMCHKLRGMYAFAIWDTHEQTLFLARDPFGIKPLYLHDNGQTLRFASQVKALLAGGAIERDIDPIGEASYWIWGHISEPHTLYNNIRAFEPGTWMKLSRSGQRNSGTFESVGSLLALEPSFPVSSQNRSRPEAERLTLRDVLLDTVRHHLIADVPIGIFLSSGFDSATLVALAAECGATLNTITLGFDEFRGTPDDETLLAEQIAHRYGAKHQTLWISRKDFEDIFEQFLATMDQPTIDGLNTWLVARAGAQLGFKVAISGLGGDELFGGYPSFRQIPGIRRLAGPFTGMPYLGKLVRQLSAPMLRRFTNEKYAGLLEYGGTWEGAYMLRRAMRMPWELEKIRSLRAPANEIWMPPPVKMRGAHNLEARGAVATENFAIISYLESIYYMRNQLLRDTDWAGMAHSIELRVPLVDVELTRHIGRRRMEGRQYTKQDLAATAQPALPQSVLKRPKSGFTVPVRDWLLQAHDPRRPQRGLRNWQETIAERFLPP